MIIALPTCPKTVELFEKKLIGGFSCVNTALAFDTKILIPNLTSKDFDKTSIDDSFNKLKEEDLKVVYRLQLNDEYEYHGRRVVSKILKMDKNNQYGQEMTKPLPTGCIKKEKTIPIWYKFNLLTEKVSVEDKIGHLFVADIKFDKHKAGERQYLFNEIYLPIFDKNKALDLSKRLFFNLSKR